MRGDLAVSPYLKKTQMIKGLCEKRGKRHNIQLILRYLHQISKETS